MFNINMSDEKISEPKLFKDESTFIHAERSLLRHIKIDIVTGYITYVCSRFSLDLSFCRIQ